MQQPRSEITAFLFTLKDYSTTVAKLQVFFNIFFIIFWSFLKKEKFFYEMLDNRRLLCYTCKVICFTARSALYV